MHIVKGFDSSKGSIKAGMQRRVLLCAVALLLRACAVSALYQHGGPVVDLTADNFDAKIKYGGGVWLVEFFAPWCGHCKSLQPAYEEAAKALKGIVNVAAVDADQHKALGQQYGVQGFPTIKLMYANEKGDIKSVNYQGQRTAAALVEFAVDKAKALALKRLGVKPSAGGAKASASGSGGGNGGGGMYGSGSAVVSLTDSNFESEVLEGDDLWMVEFYAPWCGHCKNLKPTWEEAAGALKGRVRVGAIDCTEHQATCGRYGVQGYPTSKFFGASKRPEDYTGGRDLDSIVGFASSKYSQQAPPPEVQELTSQAAFEKHCTGAGDDTPSKALCFLAFLPDVLDSKAAGRNRYLDTLKGLANEYKDRPWSYLWAQGGQQQGLESAFELGGFGYPALVAYRPKDKRFMVCNSAFELDKLKEWVGAMRTGGTRVLTLAGDLPAAADVAPWNGQDAQEVVEDEFDLADIMKEEL